MEEPLYFVSYSFYSCVYLKKLDVTNPSLVFLLSSVLMAPGQSMDKAG